MVKATMAHPSMQDLLQARSRHPARGVKQHKWRRWLAPLLLRSTGHSPTVEMGHLRRLRIRWPMSAHPLLADNPLDPRGRTPCEPEGDMALGRRRHNFDPGPTLQ